MSYDEAFWNAQAATYDDEPDHGLGDDRTRDAWRDLLLGHLPSAPADVVELGCGTGTLSVLVALAGHRVRGLDFAEAMVAAAEAKAAAAGVHAEFRRGDASAPPYGPGSCDVLLGRHILWALPDPAHALQKWRELLRPEGRVVLVEGQWSTGSGISASTCEAMLEANFETVEITELSDPVYWGSEITDERYLAIGSSPGAGRLRKN